MKEIKYFLLIGFLLILCGCDATYNLDLSSTGIKEELLINGNYVELEDYGLNKDNYEYRFLDYPIDKNIEMNDGDCEGSEEDYSKVTFYNKSFDSREDGYTVKYSYDLFKNDTFKKSTIASTMFHSFSYSVDLKNNEINIYTSYPFIFKSYPLLDSVTVNIKPEYEVISSNADRNENGIYSWDISRNAEKRIEMKMVYKKESIKTENKPVEEDKKDTTEVVIEEKKEEINENKSNEKKGNSFMTTLLLFGCFLVVLVVMLLIKR